MKDREESTIKLSRVDLIMMNEKSLEKTRSHYLWTFAIF